MQNTGMRVSVRMITMIIIILLAGCAADGGGAGDSFGDRFARRYGDAAALTLTMSATFDHGGNADTYEMMHIYDAADGHAIEVTAPAELAGLTTYITADGAQISYDGMIFNPGRLPGSYASPVNILPEILRCWREGIPSAYTDEVRGGVKCRMQEYSITLDTEIFIIRSWFSRDALSPVQTEVYTGGVRVITINYTNAE